MTDTDPKTEALYRELLMARSAEERFVMGARMCEVARATVLASLDPALSDTERKIALLRRYYAGDLESAVLVRFERALREGADATLTIER